MKHYRTAVEKNLLRLSQTLQETVFAEETASLPGWLQRVDPRVKISGILFLILACSFSQSLISLLVLFVFALILAAGSRLHTISFLHRLWFFIPLYTAVIALPALFTTPGEPIAEVGGTGWTITQQGLETAVMLVTRVTTSISCLLLLILTTRWPVLLKGLRSLGFPYFLVFLLAMTYRYIYVLLQTTASLLLARQSRKVGPEAWRTTKEWLGTISGALLGKSYSMSSEIYLAMVSRGFRGEPVLLTDFRMRITDWIWFLLFLTIATIPLLWSRVF